MYGQNKFLATLLAVVLCFFAADALAGELDSVTVSSFSSRLGVSWIPTTTLDGDSSTYWLTGKSDNAPYVIYQLGDTAIELAGLTITNVPNRSDRALDSTSISYCADDSGTFTAIGDYDINHDTGAITEIDLTGVTAKYIKIEPLSNYYYGTINYIADHALDGSATWIVGYADAIFTTPGGYANAGDDISVYDADDSGSESVTLDGSASAYPDGSITGYSWSIDSTEIATGVNPTVTLAVGEYEVILTCTLSDGGTDSDVVNVTVVGTPQSFASAGDDITVTDSDDNGSETVTLDGSNSAWSTATWQWYEGDTLLGSGQTLDVTLAVGTHTITLYCTDQSGHNDDDEVIVEVLDGSPKAPIADAGSDRTVENRAGGAGEPVTLDASGSVDYDGTIVSYSWSENGSEIATGASPTVTLAIGTHTITLTVTDDDSMSDTDELTVTVLQFNGNGGDQPRVGAWEADNLFDDITDEEFELLSTKKVLLASRSFGYNLADGLNNVKGLRSAYTPVIGRGYNVLAEGYDAVPEDVFSDHDFVQYLATYWPHTARIGEFDWLIRNRYYDDIDAALIFFHTASASVFASYSSTMDTLRLEYPDIKFIYVTSGCSPIADAAANAASWDFSQMVIAEYDGNQPIYDMSSILSTHADGSACVNTSGVPYMCPEFNINGDDTHPNSDFSETRMGKGMLVMLKKLFCETANLDGDANGDGTVDLDDFIILKQNYGATGADRSQGDFNGDGTVDLDDFIILKQNYGATNE